MKSWYFLLFFLLFSTAAFADVAQDCTDANILLSASASYDGVDWTNTTTYNFCQAGCNNITLSCNPDPLSSESTSLFYFLFPLTSAVIMYIMSTTKPEDFPLHILGLGISLWLILVPFGTLSKALPNHFLRTYQLLAVGSLIIMIYVVLKLMKRGVDHAQRGGGA